MRKTVFRNKIILITGASSGIGRALALEFARLGARLVLAARRKQRLDELVRDIDSLGSQSISVACDVNKKEDLERMVEETHQSFGLIDIVVANAGIPMNGKFEALSLDHYRQELETNVFGLIGTAYAALNDLRKTQGTLVLMGSTAGYTAFPGSSAYAMSKSAVRAFAESVRYELADRGINVVLISPGFIQSELRMVDNRGVFHPEYTDWVPGWLVMPTKKAAKKIVRAIKRGNREQFITIHARLFYFLRQYFPWLYFGITRLGRNFERSK